MASFQKLQMIEDERYMSSSSNEAFAIKQIMAFHMPDGRVLDARSILSIVEDIFRRSAPTVLVNPQTPLELIEDEINTVRNKRMFEALALPIHRISCEISCKCSGGGGTDVTILAIFKMLAKYSWDAKVVLAMAALSTTLGEFWLTVHLYSVNPLAKSIGLLKQLPDVLEQRNILKPRFDALNNIIKFLIDVANCIIEFKELPSEYITPDQSSMATVIDHIPTVAYWVMRSIVVCSSQIIGLIGFGLEHMISTVEMWELSGLAHKVSNIHGHLRKQLDLCHRHIDEKKNVESYRNLVHLFEMTHIDNMKVLKALISTKHDLPLIDGSSKRRVSVDALRRKIVILLISTTDISDNELFILSQTYNDTHQGKIERQSEMVWLPIIDHSTPWTESKQAKFHHLSSSMPWYTLFHPSFMDSSVEKYIKTSWGFVKNPIVVVMDPQGRVLCPNALHMIWIWGSLAYPFSSSREEALWKKETWKIEFLVGDIDVSIVSWAKEGRFICLYGGEDIEWIRNFTKQMKLIAAEARIPLEMVYVGKSNPNQKVRKAVETIAQEKLSETWQDPTMIWFFWVRLECIWHSKRQHGRTIDNDEIMREVSAILTFDGSEENWALISKGSNEMVKASGKKMIDCLMNVDTWKHDIEKSGFVMALKHALQPYHAHGHCNRFILPEDVGRIEEGVSCAECRRPMEKYVLYRCRIE